MNFYLRLERWRSYTASIRGLAALASGRSDRPELVAIGEAGIAGMWNLIDWLEDGLVALPDELARRPTAYAGALPPARRSEMAAGLDGGEAWLSHLLDEDADRDALERSVAMLRSVTGLPSLAGALRNLDAAGAWSEAFEVLTAAAADGGRRLHVALQALGLRFTGRPTFLREMLWR